MNQSEIVKMAAQAGARAALEEFEKRQKQDKQDRADRRLRNVKLLLRNYRMLREHIANAVYETECEESPVDIIEDLMTNRDSTVIVDSIKRSVARTAVIVQHMETMFGLYETYCFSAHATPEDGRRWRVIYGLYISDDIKSVPDLARQENVVERTIYKDIDIASERIAALMFGIDGLDRRRK